MDGSVRFSVSALHQGAALAAELQMPSADQEHAEGERVSLSSTL